MTTVLVLGLVGLALVDSTSIGTLVVPVWLLLSPKRPSVRMLAYYLATIAAFYFVVGVALALVAQAGTDWLQSSLRSPVVLVPQLAVGVGLFALSWRFDSKKRRSRGEPDRVARWRERAIDSQSSGRGLAILAVSAATLELFSMLPYLAAIGLLVASPLSAVQWIPLLACYCVVMIAPALLLVGARTAMHDRIEPLLRRIDAFLIRHADSAAGWALGIVGFLLARDAAAQLFFA
ncbi:GAP family protein [Antrihabitans sp. YC3-6]|uniref:GAP family protein n=1 Tax=Antrihabitans stalagmiti TaxID=2799499 RepID=A0A934NTV6_9NOCA|nr:GAP family protein [Antrihabitans stalagmiti]MBJ8341411.1 GAP family protein [Antrihabitans stalagmiti]